MPDSVSVSGHPDPRKYVSLHEFSCGGDDKAEKEKKKK